MGGTRFSGGFWESVAWGGEAVGNDLWMNNWGTSRSKLMVARMAFSPGRLGWTFDRYTLGYVFKEGKGSRFFVREQVGETYAENGIRWAWIGSNWEIR